MKTVAIPIESKNREFDGKLWLGLNFVGRGYEVVLGPSWELKSAIDIVEPDVYISKDPGDGNIDFFNDLRNSGIKVCGLPSETAVNSDVSHYPQNKMQVLNVLDAYFEWGQEPAKELKRVYQDQSEKIKITGNPRFDLLTSNLKSIYAGEKDQIQNEYGDFILFNTNFSVGNPVDRERMVKSVENNQPDRDILKEEQLYSRILYTFLELILYLTSEDIDYNIVLRPHPGEDHSTYRDAFEQYDDIHVKYEGDVRSWIYASKGVIHYDCTTGVEAAIMKTPVLSYQPFSDVTSTRPLSQIVSERGTTREEVREWISDTMASDTDYVQNKQQKREIKKYFPNIDRRAAPQICDTIDSLLNNSNGHSGYSVSTQKKIERRIKSSPIGEEVLEIYDITRDVLSDGDHRKSRRRTKQKFPSLSREELIKRSELMSKKIGFNGINVKSIPQTRYSYAIREETGTV
jgi:surface carbohydrate biosynthesis protein